MSVMLSFGGTSAGGAWDDRELVNAYDTAMAEFHSHHPGPGSWLDKVTAQRALQDQPGTSHQNSAWYAAPELNHDIEVDEPDVTQPRPKKRSKKQNHQPRVSNNSTPNPYSTASHTANHAEGNPTSPQYSPPSPHSPERFDAVSSSSRTTPQLYDEHHADPPASMASAAEPPAQRYPTPPPPISIVPTNAVSAADALSYAMTSQYWAGYWMGVAQARQHVNVQTPVVPDLVSNQDPGPSRDPSTSSNLVVSKHRVLKR